MKYTIFITRFMVQTSKEGQWAISRTRAVLLVETANVGIGFIITIQGYFS